MECKDALVHSSGRIQDRVIRIVRPVVMARGQLLNSIYSVLYDIVLNIPHSERRGG